MLSGRGASRQPTEKVAQLLPWWMETTAYQRSRFTADIVALGGLSQFHFWHMRFARLGNPCFGRILSILKLDRRRISLALVVAPFSPCSGHQLPCHFAMPLLLVRTVLMLLGTIQSIVTFGAVLSFSPTIRCIRSPKSLRSRACRYESREGRRHQLFVVAVLGEISCARIW